MSSVATGPAPSVFGSGGAQDAPSRRRTTASADWAVVGNLHELDYLANRYAGSSGGQPRLKIQIGHRYRSIPVFHAVHACEVKNADSLGQFHPDQRVLNNHAFTIFVREINQRPLNPFVERVVFQLHHSFGRPVSEAASEPFQTTRTCCKGCYFLVFVPTIREIRDFYREM
eukprot:SAG31_NODE_654_length_13128_cov_10.472408_10_plen_171_part_00